MTWMERKQKALDEWRDKIRDHIKKKRSSCDVKILEAWSFGGRYDAGHASSGSFKRKSKGIVYENPRILLHWYFMKILNQPLRKVIEARVKIKGWSYMDEEDALIIILGKPRPSEDIIVGDRS